MSPPKIEEGIYFIENTETKRYLFQNGSKINGNRGEEGGWLKSPKVQGTDANYYNHAYWKITNVREDYYFIENLITKRLLFQDGDKIKGDRGAEGGWLKSSGFQSPNVVGSDANYYNRAYWSFHVAGKTTTGQELYLIKNHHTGRYLFQDGDKIKGDRGTEAGWLASSGFEAPNVVGADANYYNRAYWILTKHEGTKADGEEIEAIKVEEEEEKKDKEEEEVITTGKIVICEDEWPLSDKGFDEAGESAVMYAQNIASYFMGGDNDKKGNFLVYSPNFGLTDKKLEEVMIAKGHTWTIDVDVPFTADSLKANYDGIFLCRLAANNKVLIDYVEKGGCIYICGGTGMYRTKNWKRFLRHFGFQFGLQYNETKGLLPITNTTNHPILTGVTQLYYKNGNTITNIDKESKANKIILSHPSNNDNGNNNDIDIDSSGSIAIYDGSLEESNIIINAILYDGVVKRTEADEFIEITNIGGSATDISGYKVHANDKGQDFIFPINTIIKVGQNIRIYTNQIHPESGGYSYQSNKAIWNNKGDIGILTDTNGNEISRLGYANMVDDGIADDDGIKVVRK